jgi:hypothetical protein
MRTDRRNNVDKVEVESLEQPRGMSLLQVPVNGGAASDFFT